MAEWKLEELYEEKTYMERVLCGVERLQGFAKSEVVNVLAGIGVRCMHPDPRKRPNIDWVLVALRLLH